MTASSLNRLMTLPPRSFPSLLPYSLSSSTLTLSMGDLNLLQFPITIIVPSPPLVLVVTCNYCDCGLWGNRNGRDHRGGGGGGECSGLDDGGGGDGDKDSDQGSRNHSKLSGLGHIKSCWPRTGTVRSKKTVQNFKPFKKPISVWYGIIPMHFTWFSLVRAQFGFGSGLT